MNIYLRKIYILFVKKHFLYKNYSQIRYIFFTFSYIFFSVKVFFSKKNFQCKTFFPRKNIFFCRECIFCKKHKYFFKKNFFFQLSFATNEQSQSRYCKIRSLTMRNISCCTIPHVFTSFARLKKSLTSLNVFLLLANVDVKVNKTQRIFTKILSEPGSLSGF